MKTNALRRGLACATVTTLAGALVPVLTVSAAAAGALSLEGASADGAAFDLDEHDPGDLTVQVVDNAGPVDVDDVQDLRYFWTVTPFDPVASPERHPATGRDLIATEVGGEFVVPLPPSTQSGDYTLVAALTPDASGDGAVRRMPAIEVSVGQAAIVFDDRSPVFAPAGSDRPIAGRLQLEDGTGLPGRLVDLTFVRGSAGSDPQADAGLVPDPPATSLATALQVTTGSDGDVDAVLSDPAEDGQGSELGGTLRARTVATPGIGDAGADSTLLVDLVSDVAPAGSTLAVRDLGNGRPGEVLTSRLTVTAPDDTYDTDPATPGVQGDPDTDRDPVEGQSFTLDLDHGFFTGGEVLPSDPGAPAGNVEDLGGTLTGLTDSDGRVSFAIAIGRDRGFDDDGQVSATVSAVAGDLSQDTSTTWSSADPLNGTTVEVSLSPKREQPAAVNPAVSGNRTYYDVFTLDQYGNRVGGEPVELTYSGNLDDWDYSTDFVVSDFDRSGDLWVVSFEAADIAITGTWFAPNRLYTDAAGASVPGDADVAGSTVASFYDLDFDASSFRMTSSTRGVAQVGSAVTQTVKVIDQMGNPVEGYRARFFRLGPDTGDGGPRLTEFTNRRGKATYTFVGTEVGRARVTAEVTDGTHSETLTGVVRFGSRVRARLAGQGNGRADDTLEVTAPSRAAGALVRLYRLGKGKERAVGRGTLDDDGTASFTVRDRNGKRRTTYVAVLRATSTTAADRSNRTRLR